MTWNRREVLAGLGVASAAALVDALGCRPAPVERPAQARGEVRTWLRDAVARLSAAHGAAQALAVTRRQTRVAVDTFGAGMSRARTDGAVLTVRTRGGAWREHVTSELTARGIDAAVRALGGADRGAAIDFGPVPAAPPDVPGRSDPALRAIVEGIQGSDAPSSRVVYAAALLELDDATVWSIAAGGDLEQRLARVRQRATRAAWSGARPVVAEVERGWRGAIDAEVLSAAAVAAASAHAVLPTTPGGFSDGERTVVLEPSVAALVVDAAVRALFGGTLALGAVVASPLLAIVDDPTVAGAYGGFAFDDEGELAAPIALVGDGRVVGKLSARGGGRARRVGHLGRIDAAPSHVRVAPGAVAINGLFGDGFLIEGGLEAAVEPGSDRIRVSAARARELVAGRDTGRVYADVEVVGSLAALLAAVDGIARDVETFPLRGEPWRSVAAPAIRTRALVRARRRSA